MENKSNYEREPHESDNLNENQLELNKNISENFNTEKKSTSLLKLEIFNQYSPFTNSYNKIMFNNSKEKNPFDTPDQKRIFQNSNQKLMFNSNFRMENSYGKDINHLNPQFWLNNKDGNICINIFDSNYSEKKHLNLNELNSDFVKRINFDNGELSQMYWIIKVDIICQKRKK